MDVDAVYTWVDGADPCWQARKAKVLHEAGWVAPAANHAARFRDAGEIRHSIASLLMHAPWIRRIFVVTDNQRPGWIDDASDKITLVDHREIFCNPDWLPCYAARGIESQLHHIPGLADQYLYFNDDMFLGRPVSPGTFFDSRGRPYVFTATRRPRSRPWHANPQAIPAGQDVLHLASVELSRRAVLEACGVCVAYDIRHQVKVLSRRLMLELEGKFAAEFEQVAKSRFRSSSTINPVYLHAFYGLATGQAVPRYVRSVRDEVKWKDTLSSLFGWDDSCLVNLKGPHSEARLQRVADRPPRFICLNQTEVTTESDIERFAYVMKKLWPLASSQ